jgi:hypothetical protein
MNASTGIRVVYSKSSSRRMDRVTQVNRELWLVLSLFVIAGLLNWLVAGLRLTMKFVSMRASFGRGTRRRLAGRAPFGSPQGRSAHHKRLETLGLIVIVILILALVITRSWHLIAWSAR